jgi:TPR repeat protein
LGQLRLDQGRVEEAVRHFEVAAAAGNREAHHNLGTASARGVGGRPKDDRVAIRHYLEARLPQSLNAASKAFARLGDDEAADAWLRRAASLGSEPAKRRLAAAEAEL